MIIRNEYFSEDVKLELNKFMINYIKDDVININIELIENFYDYLMKKDKIFDNKFINDVEYLVKKLENTKNQKFDCNTFLEYLLNIFSYYILCISYDKNKIKVLSNISIDYYNKVFDKPLYYTYLDYYNYLLNILKNIIEKNKNGDFKDYLFIKHHKIDERINKYISSNNIVYEYIRINILLKHICIINENVYATILKKFLHKNN